MVSRRSPSLGSVLLKTVGLSKPVVPRKLDASDVDEAHESRDARRENVSSGSTRERVSTRPSEEDGKEDL